MDALLPAVPCRHQAAAFQEHHGSGSIGAVKFCFGSISCPGCVGSTKQPAKAAFSHLTSHPCQDAMMQLTKNNVTGRAKPGQNLELV